ncbi:hypothetical protein [uncultured Ferrimonas sp.]|uniref:hypothetical protein n=1 Tax=uncultured Ferrimonas sp. TaxID=432640 RepID=UPI002626FE54|nr:hypothetical protein [uncultured Ferrimonas sp.]
MRAVIVALGLLALSGCGEPELVWQHPDKENHNFLQDREICAGRIDSMNADYKALFDQCMVNLGWQQQQIN